MICNHFWLLYKSDKNDMLHVARKHILYNVPPVKAQISMHNHIVWSEPSLEASVDPRLAFEERMTWFRLNRPEIGSVYLLIGESQKQFFFLSNSYEINTDMWHFMLLAFYGQNPSPDTVQVSTYAEMEEILWEYCSYRSFVSTLPEKIEVTIDRGELIHLYGKQLCQKYFSVLIGIYSKRLFLFRVIPLQKSLVNRKSQKL